jgi:hypothetical protein
MDSIGQGDNSIDRLDLRPDKGIIKVLFTKGYWELQVDWCVREGAFRFPATF